MRRINALIAIVLAALTATATPRSPQQALSEARATLYSGLTRRVKVAAASDMRLAYTMSENARPTLYIFTSAADPEPGFMVVSADDVAPALLGYSDEARFDAQHIPSNVEGWLKQYSLYISQQVEAGAPAYQQVARRDTRAAISPLVKVTWDQVAPYNNLLPSVAGYRPFTGCVATTLAQILKTHAWPTRGEGSHSYNFTYGGRTYSASFNFGNTTFDYANMLNSYPTATSGTTTQRNAVATLMYAVGVASDMTYRPEGSGTIAINAGIGLITYLKYDLGLEYVLREWYTPTAWSNMIYNELAAGRPVYYEGDDATEGHAFVCDGYSNNDYFHINWGWEGNYNGYFLLSNLKPAGQGSGGSSGSGGYNYNQGAFLKLMPAKAGSQICESMAFGGNISTDKTTYSTSSSEAITITGAGTYGGAYSYTLGTLQSLVTGVELVNGSEVEYVSAGGGNNIQPNSGVKSIKIYSTRFPYGKWRMYPAFMTNNGVWHRIHTPVGNGSVEYFNINVTPTTLTVSLPDPNEDDDYIMATYKSYTPDNANDTGFYPGHSYTFSYDVNSSQASSEELHCLLIDASNRTVTEKSMTANLKNGTTTVSFNITIPSSTSTGSYSIVLAVKNGSTLEHISDKTAINIVDEPQVLKSTLRSITPVDPSDGRTIHQNQKSTFNFELFCIRAWGPYDVRCRLLKDGSTAGKYSTVMTSNPVSISIPANGTSNGAWDLTVGEDIPVGKYYVVLIYTPGILQIDISDPTPITLASPLSGIENVSVDSEATAVYYNLSGMIIPNPGPGIYLRRIGSKIEKVIIK